VNHSLVFAQRIVSDGLCCRAIGIANKRNFVIFLFLAVWNKQLTEVPDICSLTITERRRTVCFTRFTLQQTKDARHFSPSALKVAVARSHQIQKNIIGDIATDDLSGNGVALKVNSGEDATA